jgi:hypothetical protein
MLPGKNLGKQLLLDFKMKRQRFQKETCIYS